MDRRAKRTLYIATASLAGLLFVMTTPAWGLSSPNFQLDESSIGTSGPLNQSSSNFGITDATGDIGVGNSTSSNFQVDAGSKTNADPVLAFAVNTSAVNFGTFSASTPSTTTATFSVMNYTSNGYTVQLVGSAPSNGSYSIGALATAELSQPGTDQFGVNLVANTLPLSVGANPDNGQFGFGSIATNYNTPNYYRYISGDIIAKSDKSSGITNYTITYLVNVAGLTPGGRYTSNQTLVVLGRY